ncbi:unnamed protein product [Dovyalis caffra]|uniref:Uncharacterized protein n=1 Tax=Dovyalis caffra TaxID=77055 RepID=A0AAV1STM2_9ROSI|nr:unnamed protein product [Dovyalis caffra]
MLSKCKNRLASKLGRKMYIGLGSLDNRNKLYSDISHNVDEDRVDSMDDDFNKDRVDNVGDDLNDDKVIDMYEVRMDNDVLNKDTLDNVVSLDHIRVDGDRVDMVESVDSMDEI